jgi:hypothetical protein
MGSTWNLPVKSDSFLHRIEIVECSSLSYQEPCVSCYMGILLHKHPLHWTFCYMSSSKLRVRIEYVVNSFMDLAP